MEIINNRKNTTQKSVNTDGLITVKKGNFELFVTYVLSFIKQSFFSGPGPFVKIFGSFRNDDVTFKSKVYFRLHIKREEIRIIDTASLKLDVVIRSPERVKEAGPSACRPQTARPCPGRC